MAQYIKQKIKVLKQFGIQLTQEQLTHLHGLHTEIAIDNYIRPLIQAKLEDLIYV